MTDQTMPEMSGDVFAATIKILAPDQPVLMFTGNVPFPAYHGLPNVDFLLPKPARTEEIFEAIAIVTSNLGSSDSDAKSPTQN